MLLKLDSWIVECDEPDCDARAAQLDVPYPRVPDGWEMHVVEHDGTETVFLYCPRCAPRHRHRAARITTADGPLPLLN